MIRSLILKMAPAQSRRRNYLQTAIKKIGFSPTLKKTNYHAWFEQIEDNINASDYKAIGNKIKFSIVAPCYNTPQYQFEEMVYSVINQYYENWELILVDASDNNKSNFIQNAANIDKRIRVIRIENEGISKNTNKGIEVAEGEYISLLDHDDTLTPNALSEVARVLKNDPKIDLIYSDEDKVEESKRLYGDPFFKQNFSPHLLENVNYITHFTTIRKNYIEKVGGLNSKVDGAQDYDLFLRITDDGAKTHHIPRILYHWRKSSSSTAKDISSKKYIFKAGEQALNDHFKRLGINATSKALEGLPGFYKTSYMKQAKLDVVFYIDDIYARQGKFINNWLKTTNLDSVASVHLPNEVKVWLKDQGIEQQNLQGYSSKKDLSDNISKTKPSNTVVITSYCRSIDKQDWIKELASALESDPRIFSISPLTIDNNHRIADAGYRKNPGGLLEQPYIGLKLDERHTEGYLGWVRNVSAPSKRVFATRKRNVRDYGLEKLALDFREHAKCADGAGGYSAIWSHNLVVSEGDPPSFMDKAGRMRLNREELDFARLPSFDHKEEQ